MTYWNQRLFEILYQAGGLGPVGDAAVVFFAKYLPYVVILGVAVAAFRLLRGKTILFFAAEALLAVIVARGVITEIFRFFYVSPRPFAVLDFAPLIQESSNSFPSGHAAFFFALATVVLFWNKNAGLWLFALSFLNGAARVLAGVHWPLDILGGIAVGIFSGLLVRQLSETHLKKLKMRRMGADLEAASPPR